MGNVATTATRSWLPSASHRLWQEFSPPVGSERFHCEMKRGYSRYRKNEPEVKALLALDNLHQKVGLLAQRAVWEFHQSVDLLDQSKGVDTVAGRLNLYQEAEEVQQRVFKIISNYQSHPILLGKEQLDLRRGDEGVPPPVQMKCGEYPFNVYAAIDCQFLESDYLSPTIHILDFKTGKNAPDKRQAYVYLLAAQVLFPQYSAIASFYNLETQVWTEPIKASSEALESVLIELARLSKQCEKERSRYKRDPQHFSDFFPPNPGFRCQNCTFKTICQYAE